MPVPGQEFGDAPRRVVGNAGEHVGEGVLACCNLPIIAGMLKAMLSGMEASGTRRGEYYLPNQHLMYAAQVVTQDLYPRLLNLIRDLAGCSLIMLPSSFRDWANPELAPILHRTQQSPNLNSEEK